MLFVCVLFVGLYACSVVVCVFVVRSLYVCWFVGVLLCSLYVCMFVVCRFVGLYACRLVGL